MNETIDALRFPVGEYSAPAIIDAQTLNRYIDIIGNFPERLRTETAHLSNLQLDTPYRPEGWTIRQVVHHCADSHMNSFIRFKLALTESKPAIKPYNESEWAKLEDSYLMPIEPSLLILDGLHARWYKLLLSLKADELKRTFVHPQHGKIFRLDENTGIYAWHCEHHLAHITSLKKRMNWL